MRILFTKHFIVVVLSFFYLSATAQNSILVNFGSNACGLTTPPSFSLMTNPLSGESAVIANCNIASQPPFYFPDYFNVFVAYNPKDNKVYLCDIRLGASRVWKLDMGLPGDITCPPTIPEEPTYAYPYLPNNFEFDNNGDLWSFSNYDFSTGRCSIDRFNVTNGNVFASKTVQFPEGNFPTSMNSGDVTILPNGRMFATFGAFPSQLYEILNYNGEGDAFAIYQLTLPQNTFGIAYLNGKLEITGTDNVFSCYYYEYDIFHNTLSEPISFQNGQSPIDNTSISPAIGTTKRLLAARHVNATTADLTYEVYVRNMGNVVLNNINATDDLGAAFGANNVSNVSVSFAPNGNNAGLLPNSSYNGTTDINLLNAGQSLPNQSSGNNDYYFMALIKCRVSNLFLDSTYFYYNSAIASGTIGNSSGLLHISDSSNNGPQDDIDPNANGNPSDDGENEPTPFSFFADAGPLPVTFLTANATLINSNAIIKWTIATPTVNADRFEVQYSADTKQWNTITTLSISNTNQSNYQFTHQNIPTGKTYYRIKEIDNNGAVTYSSIITLSAANTDAVKVFPNPADNYIQIILPGDLRTTRLELFDATGRKLLENNITGPATYLNTSQLSNGTYSLRIKSDAAIITRKILIAH